MRTFIRNLSLDRTLRRLESLIMQKVYWVARVCMFVVCFWPAMALAAVGDEATHDSDHQEDVLELPEVHVDGLPHNRDQQLGPVPKATPWPAIPPALNDKALDDGMHA